MLQALICGKHRRLNEDGASIWFKEDTLTACVFERIRYLPEHHLKEVFCSIAAGNGETWTPDAFGMLQDVRFWPRFKHPDESSVEPDVVFEFEKLILIVEAKRWDAAQQQYIDQWEREMAAVLHSHPDGAKKPIRLLAVGGNRDGVSEGDVWLTTWSDFVKTAIRCCPQPETHIRAVLEGMEQSLRLHDIEMRDIIYLDGFATKLNQRTSLNMDMVLPCLNQMASHSANSLATFAATLNTHFCNDIQKTFEGVRHE